MLEHDWIRTCLQLFINEHVDESLSTCTPKYTPY